MSDRYGLQRRSGGPVARRESAYRPDGDGGHRTPGYGQAHGRSDLRRYREILIRRGRTVAWTFVLVVVAVTVGTLLQERVYRATGLLEIRTASAGIASTHALFSSDRVTATVLGTEQGLLRTPALARRVVTEHGVSEAVKRRSGPNHLLRGEVLANRELYGSIQRKRDEARVSAALNGTGAGIVDLAVPPGRPHRPKVAYHLALALLAGLVIGLAGTFLREYFDDTAQTGEDLGTLSQVPVLALIPLVESAELLAGGGMGRSSSENGGGRLIPGGGSGGGAGWSRSHRHRSEAGARESLMEAFGMLRTGVLYRMKGPGPRTILVSSCHPGEGKTTICLNLGISLRRVDQRVLLVDADLRRSSMNRTLGIPRTPGLADHLRNGGDWRSLVRSDRDEGVPHLLPSGGPVDDAGDLLSHPRVRTLLDEAGREYDVVLVDAPALFVNAPDARLLSRLVPHVLLVARSGQTPNALFSAVVEATPNALGTAVNGLDIGRLPGEYREFFTPYSERWLAEGEVRPAGSGSPRPAATGAGSGFGGGLLLWLGLVILLWGPPGGPGGLGPFHL